MRLAQLAAVVAKINTWQFDSWAAEEWSEGGCALLPTFMAICEAWQLPRRLGIPRQALMATAMRLEDLGNAVGTKEGESMATANDRQARAYAHALRRRSRASVAKIERSLPAAGAPGEGGSGSPQVVKLPPLVRGHSHRQSVGADPAALDTQMAVAHHRALQRGQGPRSSGSVLGSGGINASGPSIASAPLSPAGEGPGMDGETAGPPDGSPPPFLPMDFLARAEDAYHGSKKAADAI